jgi:D-3-phosphoglycerate dehydrogenase / 2-oxoglutarate reductase
MHKILVTPRSLTKGDHPALDALKQAGFEVIFATPGKQPDQAELMRLLPGCVGMLAGVERINAAILEVAKDLKAISRNGTGVDNIDLEAAQRLNVAVLRAEGANARGVAELAIGLLFAGIRAIPYSDAQMKAGKWSRKQGIEIAGRTLGMIGCGKIGKLVAQMALGLGMQVLAYDAFPDAAFAPSPAFKFTSLDEVLARADVLSLHCPPPQDGKPIITSEAIARMKQGVYLINTARAALLDDDAVFAGLQSGRIAGLATDVYDQEPPAMTALLAHENVIVTPHIGGFTVESVENASRVAVENLLHYFQ